MKSFTIASHRIGDGRCFVIAEAGVNHNGEPDTARALVDAAVAAGADAVKFQTFKSELVISAEAPKAAYQKAATGAGESQLEMVRRLELSEDDFRGLKAYCDARKILFLSTPFDHPSVDFLDSLGVPAFKAPSGEITNLPLLGHMARLGKPVILSTGMAALEEVERAVTELRAKGCPALSVLHCVSNYPADPADANLRAMKTMAEAFDTPVGYSDHTTGIDIALAAVALGAAVIEKHFTLDKSLPGPDHQASLDPAELAALVAGIRRIESALGDGVKAPRPSEADTRQVARRSLFLRAPLAAGEDVDAEQLIALRPAGGIAPNEIERLAGRRALHDLAAGAMLRWSDLA
jgi:N-acetylneuraminate synthase/N,N'-diacetyllegionaminate synthase